MAAARWKTNGRRLYDAKMKKYLAAHSSEVSALDVGVGAHFNKSTLQTASRPIKAQLGLSWGGWKFADGDNERIIPILLLNDWEKQHQSSSAFRWGTFDKHNDITLNEILKSSVTNQDYIIPRGFSSR